MYTKSKALETLHTAGACRITATRSTSRKPAARPVLSPVPLPPSIFAMAVLGVMPPSSSLEVGRSSSEVGEGAADSVSTYFSKWRPASEEE
ncbi:hypothetical protein QYF36_003608 [Acer negundo]|nr:hypothetical protein QYF36_003608 [Acer negundo]